MPRFGRPLRVLVVDDEQVSRHILEQFLIADGHSVVTAVSGAEASAIGHAERFDLMITDHGMPDMNGVQLAAAIREIHADHPVILLTGFSEIGAWPHEQVPDVDLILRKPVARGALRKAIQTVMDGKAGAVEQMDSGSAASDGDEMPRAMQAIQA